MLTIFSLKLLWFVNGRNKKGTTNISYLICEDIFQLHYSLQIVYYIVYVITGSIARSAKRRYLSYSEADFEVFRPTGATRCTDGVKFGTGKGAEGV